MDVDVEEKERKIIPRWRDFRTTLALGELKSTGAPSTTEVHTEGSIAEQLEDWQKNKSLAFATDLVGSGFVLGKNKEVEEAADFILSNASTATNLQKRIARQVKDPNVCADLSVSEDIQTKSSGELIDHSKALVKLYRNQLRDAPRNPIKLVELAHEHTILGSTEKAARLMDVAVALAPTNRFVLRSAVRLYVHTHNIDKAHGILKRAQSLRSDPWLLAAEIAISSMRDKTSSYIKLAKRQIEDTNFSIFEMSELTGAVATIEMQSNSKLARKLFRRALRKPTENSIAQAEWASRTMSSFSLEGIEVSAPRNFEALAWRHFKEAQWDQALEQGINWIFDQPFAVSPILFSGSTATLIENFERGAHIYRFGVAANPENQMLKNNLAFALASNNETQAAEVEFEKIDRTSLSVEEQITTTATEGLINFRKGFKDVGRAFYRRAIEIAQENKESSYALRALVFLAREEINARTEFAKPTFENVEREAQNFVPTHELTVLINRLKTAIEANPDAFSSALRVGN